MSDNPQSEAPPIRIFSYGLVRWAGLSFDRIDDLTNHELIRAWGRLDVAHEALRAVHVRLCDEIAELVPHAPSPAIRGDLIALRRTLFHAKPRAHELLQGFLVKTEPLSFPSPQWTTLLRSAAEECCLWAELETKRTEFTSAYEVARSNVRRKLGELVEDPWFSRGLAVASPQLVLRIQKVSPRLRSRDPSLGRSERQLELTLLRYATRAGAKTSPFSSLGLVAWGRWDEPCLSTSHPVEVRRVARFNQRRLAAWMQRARQDAACRREMRIEGNPTLCLNRDAHTFFLPPDEKGDERYCRLPLHSLVSNVLEALQEGALPFSALVARLAPAVDEVEGTRWLEQLLKLGVLQWCVPHPGDDWVHSLLGEPALDAQKRTELERLQAVQTRFVTACPTERAAAWVEGELHLPDPTSQTSAIEATDVERAPEPLLFEDCYMDGMPRVPKIRLESWVRTVDRLVQAAWALTGGVASLTETFREVYGLRGRAPLLELAKHHSLRRRRYASSRSAFDALVPLDVFDACIRRDGEFAVHFRSEELAAGLTSLGGGLPQESLSAFLQITHDAESAVHNGVLAGHGRAWSRFLHVHSSIADAIREENRRSCGDSLCTEITASSLFNGNVHPPLADYELVLPGGPCKYPPAARIRPSELEVVDLGDGRLSVRHPGREREVRLLWLGFEATDRSGLLSVLKELALDFVPDPRQLLGPLNRWWVQRCGKSEVGSRRRLPRVVVDDGLVLQRMTWIVPRELLPELKDSAGSLALLQQFRTTIGLPRRVFFTAVQLSDLEKLNEAERQRIRADDRKPQYLDLYSPWAAPLLRLPFSRCPRNAVFVEMEPRAEQLVEWNGVPRVCECVVQWTRCGEVS